MSSNDHESSTPVPRPSLLVLRSPDPDALRSFYEAVGFTFVDEQHGSGPRHLAATAGDFVLELYPLDEDQAPSQPPRLGFVVDDLHAVGDKLGLPTDGVHHVVATDPDGRRVELTQRAANRST